VVNLLSAYNSSEEVKDEHPPRRTLTIVIPAFNEQDRIQETVEQAYQLANLELDEFEILVVDDGSTDNTSKVLATIASHMRDKIVLIRQRTNQGVGAAYRVGVERAKFPYLTLLPGDNAFGAAGVRRVFRLVGSAPLVISYRENPQARAPMRRGLSRVATFLVGLASGHQVKDAHSLYVFPLAEIRCIPVSSGYSYHLETLVRLLRRVERYVEVPVDLNPKPDESSGVMKFRTLWVLGTAMLKLLSLRIIGRL
jgi:glycosyltransferase involved in cell wall biosynthesis